MMKKHSERIELLVTNHPRNYSIKDELKIIENFLNELSKILNIDFGIKYNTDSLIKNKTIELSERYKLAWCYSAWCKNHPDTSYIDIPLLNGTCDLDSDYKIYDHHN
ncbi:hypothetical protein SOV88_19625 [Pectobacterium brasiliense]|nr:hypothetical protein [Pectobacterium brasiliense]